MHRLILPLLLTLAAHVSAVDHPFSEWQQRAPFPASREIRDIAFDGTRHIALNTDPAGRALVSTDGETFAYQTLDLPPGVVATRLVYAHGQYLAVAGGRIWRRTLWTDAWIESAPLPKPIAEIRALDDGFWAWSAGGYSVGPVWNGSLLFRSTDGVSWQQVTVGTGGSERFAFTEIAHADGKFVLTNSAGVNTAGIWTSADGDTWQAVAATLRPYYSLSHGGGRFVAGGSNGLIAISTDGGVAWSYHQFPFVIGYLTNGQPGSATPMYSVAREMVFSNGRFVALGEGYSGISLLAESTDGTEWTAVSGEDSEFAKTNGTSLRQIDDDTFLLGTLGNLWRTTLWQSDHTQLLPLAPWDWTSVAASETRLVVAGEDGHVLWSDDAETFHPLTLPDPVHVLDIVWAEEIGRFLTVGGDNSTARVWLSADGATWTAHTPVGFTGQVTGVAWDGQQFVIVGGDGQISVSSDGTAWQAKSSGIAARLTAVEWGGGHFVATASGGLIVHSTDGETWISHALGTENVTYNGLVYGDGLWVVPDGYKVHLSTDLDHWWTADAQSSGPNIAFAFGEFVTSDQRYVVSSTDGVLWQPRMDGQTPASTYSTNLGFSRGARFQNRVVFVGSSGMIATNGEWRDFFREWQLAKFTPAELADPAISGPDSDPDNDGWSNAFEYAFDLNPKASEETGKTTFTTRHVDNEYYFTGIVGSYDFPWSSNRPGVTIRAESSRDLIHWQRDGTTLSLYQIGPRQRGSVQMRFEPGGPQFLRLRAEPVTP